MITSIPAALTSFGLERRRRRSNPGTFPFTWGYYVSLNCVFIGVVCAAAGVLLTVTGDKDVSLESGIFVTAFGAVYAAAGYYGSKRSRAGLIASTILSFNVIWWVANSIYVRNRWGELAPAPRTVMRALLIPLALMLSGAVEAQRPAFEIPQIASAAKGSLVLIKAYSDDGLLQQGSGFRISGGRIATNAHVVANATRVEVFGDEGKLLGTTQYAEAISSSVDIAILPRLGASGVILPLSGNVPAVGEKVIVLGAPEGLTNTVSDGIVSALRTLDGQSLIQISAPISPGSSGGPVLNNRGEVIGVSVATYREGQNLNFAVPVTDLFAVASSPAGRISFPKEASRAHHASDTREPWIGDLQIGVPQSHELNGSGFVVKSGAFMDVYVFSGRAGQRISILARSDDFDAMLSIARFIGDSIDEIDTDDDGAGQTNPLINVALPVTGKYMISVFAHEDSDRKDGRYTIDVREGSRPHVARSSSETTDTSESDRWVFAAASDINTTSIDRTSVRPLGAGKIQFWIRVLEQSPRTDETGDTYDKSLYQYEVDCLAQSYRRTAPYQYLSGKLVWSPSERTMTTWRSPVPSSVGEKTVRVACQLPATH